MEDSVVLEITGLAGRMLTLPDDMSEENRLEYLKSALLNEGISEDDAGRHAEMLLAAVELACEEILWN